MTNHAKALCGWLKLLAAHLGRPKTPHFRLIFSYMALSEEQEIKMEDANIESIQSHHEEIDDMELEYSEEVAADAVGGYSEIGDDDVRELVPEVEIPTGVSWIF